MLSTADAKGRVDAAVYSRPHVLCPDTVSFIMPHRLTHQNLQANPHAPTSSPRSASAPGDAACTEQAARRNRQRAAGRAAPGPPRPEDTERYLVIFKIDKVLPWSAGEGE